MSRGRRPRAREATSAPILERLGVRTVYRFTMLATPDLAPDHG